MLSLMLFLVALSPWFPLTALILTGLGAATIVFAATANTSLQLAVPDELRGRVMSVYTLVFLGSTPIGSLYIGSIAKAWSVPVAVSSAGAICGVATLAAAVYAAKRRPGAAAREAEVRSGAVVSPGEGPAAPGLDSTPGER